MSSVTPPTLAAALQVARDAFHRSYAPYSKFRMGAAVVTGDGRCLPGALVENISFGLAMCAERVALFGAIAAGADRPELLVLRAARTAGGLTWPCGACLQVALELGGPELVVVVCDLDGEQAEATIRELAPLQPYKPPRR